MCHRFYVFDIIKKFSNSHCCIGNNVVFSFFLRPTMACGDWPFIFLSRLYSHDKNIYIVISLKNGIINFVYVYLRHCKAMPRMISRWNTHCGHNIVRFVHIHEQIQVNKNNKPHLIIKSNPL